MTTKPHAAEENPRIDLSRQLLLAMPGRVTGELANTVIYVCEHTEHGALGLVVNRPTDLTIGDLLQRIDLPLSLEIGPVRETPVFFGGPVQTDRGFVLHVPRGDYNSSIPVDDNVALTTSRDVLQDVAAGHGPAHLLVTLGYAGWGAGQLEDELASNAWLNVLSSHEILFDTPAEQRYDAALAQLGIRSAMLASDAGHA
ncbi:YqgE/AlgH family protein [Castellaniella sp.]|jgi:putative transcriptional regulator|uniref:YqgE/AlgH family protein n=1 Tax=Castellaniella sp. TaxID=1955812 RepID=UPI003A944727